MRRSTLCLLTLSSILPGSACSSPPVAVAVDLLCSETTRYHATDHQVAAAKADPGTWFDLFKWLASFDVVRDKKCGQ